VKMDKSFVGLMDVSPNDAAVVRSVIELGKDLGIEVVAEGVETEANLQILRQLGCSVAQGYHIGVPSPPVEFLTMATEWNASGAAHAATNIHAIRARSSSQGPVFPTPPPPPCEHQVPHLGNGSEGADQHVVGPA